MDEPGRAGQPPQPTPAGGKPARQLRRPAPVGEGSPWRTPPAITRLEHLLKTATAQSRPAERLSKEAALRIRQAVEVHAESRSGRFLWERLAAANRSICHWDQISDLFPRMRRMLVGREVVVFEDGSLPPMLCFPNGADYADAMEALPYMFEHYVTNNSADFVIALSHERILVGVGVAAEWVDLFLCREGWKDS